MNERTCGRGRAIALLTLLIVGLAVGSVAGQAAVIYVDVNATGTPHNGTTWTNAYTDLQAALGVAASGDQIWVAAGTYTPGATQTSSFALKNGVALYGGYPTGGGSRDVAANVTVLSGDVDRNDAGTGGIDTSIFEIQGNNAYHVVTSENNAASTVLDGFTITGGDADKPGVLNGVYGAGMILVASSAQVVDCTFTGNLADLYNGGNGGGMYIDEGSTPTIEDCTFLSNEANYGGGMYNAGYGTIVTGCTFLGNVAVALGVGSSAPPSALGWGGGIADEGGASITNCTICWNDADYGGGLVADGEVTNCTFTGNEATFSGGAIYAEYADVYDCILWGNAGGYGYAEIGVDTTYSGVAHAEYCVIDGYPDSVQTASGSSYSHIIAADPKLGVLGNYGGPTETIPIESGSSAIDAAVYPSGVSQPPTDQRGVTRPQGTACDIGAYESSFSSAPAVGDVNSDGVINILDVRLCLQIALGVIPGTAAQRSAADMNGDGQVTLADAQLLADYVIGLGTTR